VRQILIVSPHFPPVNAPDHHRVRMSLSFFQLFGWAPIVLAVEPRYVEVPADPVLLQTLPNGVPTYRVNALDQRWTRKLGLGNLGLRAFPFILEKGNHLIKEHTMDLVYFSTTMFAVMPAGRIWRRRFGVPFVLDIQDPWLSTYYERKPKGKRPPKYWFAHTLDRILEPWTMRRVSGVTVVSDAYAKILRSRYPWIAEEDWLTLPFGASERDTELAASLPDANQLFQRDDGFVHGVYVGRAGRDMDFALSVLFSALRDGRRNAPELFAKIRLHFIGTDYAPADKARRWVIPIASRIGVEQFVTEEPNRIGYFDGLALLNDADFLLVPGSDDPQYTASKIYPYILARKPLLAVFHEMSSVVSVLRQTRAGEVVTFSEKSDLAAVSAEVGCVWRRLLERIPFPPATDWEAFQPFTAKEMTRKLCTFFDGVMERNRV
jgi:Glycosyl transferase 4-like domain